MIANLQKVPTNFADYDSIYPNGEYVSELVIPNMFPDVLKPPSLRAESKTPGGALAITAPFRPIHSQTVPFVPRPDYQQQVMPLKVEPRVLLNNANQIKKEETLENLAKQFFLNQEEKRLKREIENYKDKGLPPPPISSEEASAIRNAPNFRMKDEEIRNMFKNTLTNERIAQTDMFDELSLRRRADEQYENLMEVEPVVALPASVPGLEDEDVGPEGGGYERKEQDGDEVQASSSSKGKRGRKTAASMGEETKAQIKKRESEENRFAIQQGRPIPYPDRLSITNKLKYGVPLNQSEQLKLAQRKKR